MTIQENGEQGPLITELNRSNLLEYCTHDNRIGAGFVLTEQDAEEIWKWSRRMEDQGFIARERIYTGTIRCHLTEKGHAFIGKEFGQESDS